MQALAREMNLSETTFILPREPELEVTEGRRVRIFTTREDLPFAGHPTLGTALYLYSTTNTALDFSDRARESWVELDLKSLSQAVDTDQHSGSASEKEL